MGVIVKEIEVEGDKGKSVLRTLFDTGASHSLVRRDKVEAIATIVPLAQPWRFQLGDGKSVLEVREGCMLTFTVKGLRYLFYFLVADNLAHELIIGADAMQVWKIKPVPEEDDVQVDPSALQLWLV
ncbi:MAG: retropepsin-like aspartic protease [Armatimonadota bacterium]|nr:retropepsin-like domain-containing protein [Armatimonadota bacterium]MDW8026694.1 retropepsin-like aspartic protease [Armatimonadota bacterium]